MDITELESSELGTQSYWQDAYSKEIANFEEHGDPGDVWFGEDSAMRVVHWMCNCGAGKDTPIIDLGCGNGYTLMELAKEGFTNLLGIDYCEEAIALAEKISQKEFPVIKYQMDQTMAFLGISLDSKLQWDTHITTLAGKLSKAVYAIIKIRQFTDVETARLVYFAYFHSVMCYGIQLCGKAIDIEVFDIIKDNVESIGKFGIVHDKGTYDAISLNPDNPRKNREKYISQVVDMLLDDGIFVITSCNWTEEELVAHFTDKLRLRCVIPTPQFKFGGKIGSVVSSVVFVKK